MGLMSKRNYNVSIGITVCLVLFMTWLFPLSPTSLYKSYTYTPHKVTYSNGKSYEAILKEFKISYEKELIETLTHPPNNKISLTIDRTQYILPLFEQDWLVRTEKVRITKDKLNHMLHEVIKSRNTLLDLIAQVDYTDEERVYIVDFINHLLTLEEEIRYVKDGHYFSRIELSILFQNLRESFRHNLDVFVSIFYERITKQ